MLCSASFVDPLTINVDAQSATSDLPSSISSSVNSFVYRPMADQTASLQKQIDELTVNYMSDNGRMIQANYRPLHVEL